MMVFQGATQSEQSLYDLLQVLQDPVAVQAKLNEILAARTSSYTAFAEQQVLAAANVEERASLVALAASTAAEKDASNARVAELDSLVASLTARSHELDLREQAFDSEDAALEARALEIANREGALADATTVLALDVLAVEAREATATARENSLKAAAVALNG